MSLSSTVVIVVAAASGFALWLFVGLQRRKRDLRQYLEPPLQKCGVEFLSSTAPGFFRIGPFPKIEFEVRPQSSVAGIQGSYDENRIVDFRDADGHVHRIWARVEFNNFHFSRIRWRAEQKEGLPPTILGILEN
jgi:hypothetical protein